MSPTLAGRERERGSSAVFVGFAAHERVAADKSCRLANHRNVNGIRRCIGGAECAFGMCELLVSAVRMRGSRIRWGMSAFGAELGKKDGSKEVVEWMLRM